MAARNVARLSLIALLILAPGFWPLKVQKDGAIADAALSPEIERQLCIIEDLSKQSDAKPDPRLFGAITRLEEMLPRSIVTRRLQEEGRHLYLKALTARTPAAAQSWERKRTKYQALIERDSVYMNALHAVDSHLTASRPAISQEHASAGRSPQPRSLPLDQMRPGDIMIWDDRSGRPFVRFAVSFFALRCTHSAIYLGMAGDGAKAQRHTYEALNPALGVRESVMDGKWTRPGLHVALGHVNGLSPAQAEQIVRQAVAMYGGDGRTPYHLWPPWDKTYYRGELYCSQLVWRIFAQHGVDIDSNDWQYIVWFALHNWFDPYAAPTAYFGVFPDEIKTSPNITWYYDQVNPKL